MDKKFNPSKFSKLDNPQRRKILPPYEILNNVSLNKGDVFVDIGCGIGYFSIPASDMVGNSGIIYALDISEVMLEELGNRSENIDNIIKIQTQENDFRIENSKADIAFMSMVLHEVDDMDIFINEVKRIIKSKGKIAIVEWIKKEGEIGPPIHHRLDEQEVVGLLKRHNFKNITVSHIGQDFYLVQGNKQ